MKRDARLSAALHQLLHLAHRGEPMTSEQLAACLDTNPVVVRRTLAGLRDAGLVTSERGHGGGWRFARALEDITLRDVYDALGEPALFGLENPEASNGCAVHAAVHASLDGALREAAVTLLARFSEVTLADLAADFSKRCNESTEKGSKHQHVRRTHHRR